MPYSATSIIKVLAQHYARHRRHGRCAYWSVSFLTEYNRPGLARFAGMHQRRTTQRAWKSVMHVGGYTIGDENCLYLYGPEDIRY